MASVQYCILFLGFPGGALVKNLPASACKLQSHLTLCLTDISFFDLSAH